MNVQLQQHDLPGIRTVIPGFKMEWLRDHKILVFTMTSPSPQAIEAYYEANLRLIEQANLTPEVPVVVLQDLADPNMTLTPQLRDCLEALAQQIRAGQAQYYSAMVLSKSPASLVFSLFGTSFSRSAMNITQKLFTDRQQAIAWLEPFVK